MNKKCLNKPTTKPYNYDKIKLSMITDGYEVTSKKYFGSNHKFLKLLMCLVKSKPTTMPMTILIKIMAT